MTEQTWLHDNDYRGMMDPVYLRGDRKQRLFAVACARLVSPHLPALERPAPFVLEVAERFADGPRDEPSRSTSQLFGKLIGMGGGEVALNRATTAWNAWAGATIAGGVLVTHCGESVAADLLRSIVGNPFSPIREVLPRRGGMIMLDAWHGGVYHFPEQPALDLAEAAYEHRQDNGRLDPVLLAILSDVLEDHGLPDAMLQAMPGPRASYRGLWALDLILGKG